MVGSKMTEEVIDGCECAGRGFRSYGVWVLRDLFDSVENGRAAGANRFPVDGGVPIAVVLFSVSTKPGSVVLQACLHLRR